jgi:hypothetical protein
VHVAHQGLERVCLVCGPLRGIGGALQGVEDDCSHQGLAVGESAVQGRDAGAGAASDVVEWRRWSALDKRVPGGGQDPVTVGYRVGPQGPGTGLDRTAPP